MLLYYIHAIRIFLQNKPFEFFSNLPASTEMFTLLSSN